MQLAVGGTAVSDVGYNAQLKYLLIRLASGSRQALEALEPDIQGLRALQKGSEPVFGIIVTTAAGERIIRRMQTIERLQALLVLHCRTSNAA